MFNIPSFLRYTRTQTNLSYFPVSSTDQQEYMPDPSGAFLTTSAPPPQQQQQQQQQHHHHHHQPQQQQQHQTFILPIRGLASGASTVPNSPVVLDGLLPPNFIPQTLTNSRGVSTPISRSSGLPSMGTHSGMSSYPRKPASRVPEQRPAPPGRCTATHWHRIIGRNSLNHSHHWRRLGGAINRL